MLPGESVAAVMDSWRLLISPPASGANNMALDQAVAECVQAGNVPPTLRFYTWHPRALSLGYSQTATAVNSKRAGECGIDLIRRPTGGQAILHSDELTYAVALPRSHRLAAGGILHSYSALSEGLLGGLDLLGLAPQIGDWSPGYDLSQETLCFGSASTHEIAVGGHKVIGSAQCRVHRGVLQHGSIVLAHDPDIFSVMGVERPDQMLLGLRTILAKPITVGGLIERFAEGFARRLRVTLRPGILTAQEQARANELAALRYSSHGWLTRC